MIKNSLSSHFTDITPNDSCAKKSAMVRITVENLGPSASRPESNSSSSKTSSPNTSAPFRPIENGINMSRENLEELERLLALLDASVNFGAVFQMTPRSGRLLRTILKAVLPTS